MPEPNLQLFGGDWTEQKLEALAKYLRSYTTALKNQLHFRKAYVDAFAGTGYREQAREGSDSSLSIFPELAEEEPQKFRDGSVRIALNTEPRFDSFVFIESSATRVQELAKIRSEFPHLADRVQIDSRDANEFLRAWCKETDWTRWRAVVFLDPCGLQVDWSTVEAIAATRSIDVWILFPLGVGANRLMSREFDRIPEGWRRRLDRIFGTEDWAKRFYRGDEGGLFAASTEVAPHRKIATVESIGQFYHERLKSIFAEVAPNPRILRNSTNSPLYQLHFAAGNRRGGPIAVKIAQHILDHI